MLWFVSEFEELLALQHGVVTLPQVSQHGISEAAVKARLRKGRWQRVHRGTYATFSGELTRPSQLWAAVLRVGSGAVLSHETAAEIHKLSDRESATIHVTTRSTRRVMPVTGVTVHMSAHVERDRHPALLPPRTRVEATVLDLVGTAQDLDAALSWITRACCRRLTTPQRLRAALRERTRVRWRREINEGLSDVREGAHSLLELRYVRDIERAHGLPRGKRQSPAVYGDRKRWEDVDYPEYATVVELDGRLGHTEESAWRDMRRDNASVADGRAVLRYGWADVSERRCRVAAQLANVLRRRGWRGWPRVCGPRCVVTKGSGGDGD